MKFLEDEPNRLLKRCQTIYKALKSGTVKMDDGRVFEYDLIKASFAIVGRKKWEVIVYYYPHGTHLQYDRTPRTLSIEDVDNYVDTVHSRLNVKITKDYGKPIPREIIKKKIQDKFRDFGIFLSYGEVKFKKLYTPEPIDNINEEDINEEVNDYEDAFRNLQANKGISPEERQRIEKKINVVMKAITKMPFTILEHKVKIKIPDYRMVVHPPNTIKFTNEFDQPEYQVTEPDVRIHADNALVYTDSEETYKYFIYEVKRDDFIYNVYHAIRNRLQKFNISFTLFDAPIRFENKDNDLQEQLDDFEPDEPDEFTPYGTESQKKKLRVIYKVLKEGVIRVSYKFNFINCRYVLPNKVKALFDKKSGNIIIKMPKYGFELYDEDNVLINPRTDDKTILTTYHNAYRVISQRFQKHFGVMFEHTEDIYGDLQEEVVSELTDKERKKVRAIFTAFKTGVLDLEDDRLKIRYHLISDYWIKKSRKEGILTIILKGNPFEKVIIHKIHSDGTETLVKPNGNMWNSLFYFVRSKIEKIFKQYDIDIKLI